MYKVLLLALVFFVSCGNDSTTLVEANDDTTVIRDASITRVPVQWGGCYSWVINKDSATLQLRVSDSTVTGELKYHWNEKDKNSGTIKGVIHDSLIIADYTFQSEGMTSVREVAFKMTGDSLVEGYGDYNTGGDTQRFKNTATLQFQTDRAFKKVPCAGSNQGMYE
jgi:hypothetical protein